ncbi:MAG: transporter permease [Microbacteriaceae bacterium]|nr:transporter permease [Microbacteriaceae bacterium]
MTIFSRRAAIAVLLAPALVLLLGVFILPMFSMFVTSLTSPEGGLGLDSYARFFTDGYYWGVLGKTATIGAITAVATLVLGYPVALFMARSDGWVRGVITFVVIVPHLVSVVIRNFGWLMVLGDNGVINSALMSLGWIQRPLQLLYNEFGTIVGFVDSFIAYMILALAASLYNEDPNLARAGSILGAGRLRRFLTITLPLSLPGILSGLVLVFSLVISSFITPILLGGPRVTVMATLTYQQILITLDWPFGTAISFILLATTLLVVTVVTRAFETKRYKEVFGA